MEKFQKYLVVIRYADIGSKVPVEKISGNQLTCGIETLFQIGTLNARSVIIPNISQASSGVVSLTCRYAAHQSVLSAALATNAMADAHHCVVTPPINVRTDG